MIFRRVMQLLNWRIKSIGPRWWLVLCIIFFLEAGVLFYLRKKKYFRIALSWGVLIFWLLFIMSGTVFSRHADPDRYGKITLDISSAWTAGPGLSVRIYKYTELVMNILMFIPFGFLLARCSGGRRKFVFAGCLAIALLIENLQFFLKRGLFELPDILLYLIGSMIGFGLWKIMDRLRKSHPDQ